MLTNHVAVIDSDYYDNPDNEGHIMISVLNVSDHDVTIKRGERLFQGIFMNYLVTDDDQDILPKRNGGFGSTGTSDS
jgi:dUTP pyrophosphatase